MAEEMEYDDFGSIDLSSLEQMMGDFPNLGDEPAEEIEQEEVVAEESTEEIHEESTEENKEDPSSQEIKDSSPLTPYAKMLVEEGLLPNIDLSKFDGKVESLLEAQRQYDLQRFENFKESTLDPRVKWLQDNLENGVPFNKLLEIDEQNLTINSITEESLVDNENLQKDILRAYYRETTELPEDRIDRIVERLETLGELEAESKVNLQDLKAIVSQKEKAAIEQAKVDQANYVKAQQDALNNFKDTLLKTNEIVPGLKVSELMKDRIYKTLTTPVATDEQTGAPLNKIAKARAEDPINFEIKLAWIFEATNGFKDWSALSSPGKRKALEEFENSLKNVDLGKSTTKSPLYKQGADSSLKEMEQLLKRF